MELFTIIGLAVLTFFTRIINLLVIPIFTDEAIYIRWAQIGFSDPAHRYLALTDGKQPLLIWLMYPALQLFSDPLFAGRFVSVVSGVLASIGVYFATRELFGKKTAVYAMCLYIFSPFTLLYDRLALMDSLLTTFGVWSLYLEILLVRRLRLDVALLLGLTIGFGLLTKSSAQFYLYLIPVSLLFFDFCTKKRIHNFCKWVGLNLISGTLSLVMYNSLRLSPWFYLIKQKNYSFILTPSEFIKNPFALFIPNLNGLVPMLFTYLTPSITLVVIIGVLWGIFRKEIRIIYLFIWFLFPFLVLAAFGKVIFPRYILSMIIPLFLIAAFLLRHITEFMYQKMKIFFPVLILILIFPLYQSILLIINPVEANIPRADRNQFFDDWPSGYGVKETISFLEKKATEGKVVIGTEGTFGLFPAVFEIYLGANKNVEIKGYWPVSSVPHDLLALSQTTPTYLVFKEKQSIPSEWPLLLTAKYRRGKGNTYLLFYQVDPTRTK